MSVMFLISIVIVMLFACIGVDVAHFVSASTELQNVADAAAMAGCFELTWTSSAAQVTAATAAAQNMIQQSNADLYSPGGIPIPAATTSINFSSRNGGTNNAITVTVSPPIAFLFAPFIGTGGKFVGAIATAQQLPVLVAPAPPWFLETKDQGGPSAPAPLPQAAPPPPTTFPTTAYVTFFDSSKDFAKIAPPVLPTYWVDMGLSNLSNAQENPVGIQQIINCLGACKVFSGCERSNPVVVNGSQIVANHGSYNSNVSNPWGNKSTWTSGQTTILPITVDGYVVGVYAVKLTGPYLDKSYDHGQGVFGEFQMEFIGSANAIPGVQAMSPVNNAVYNNVGATVAQLVE